MANTNNRNKKHITAFNKGPVPACVQEIIMLEWGPWTNGRKDNIWRLGRNSNFSSSSTGPCGTLYVAKNVAEYLVVNTGKTNKLEFKIRHL